MRIIKYKCDRCFKEVSINNLKRLSVTDSEDVYDVTSMDLCNECIIKLSDFLGIHIGPDELPFE